MRRPCGQCNVRSSNVKEAKFCMRMRNVDEKVDRKSTLQVDERAAAMSPRRAALRATACLEAEPKRR